MSQKKTSLLYRPNSNSAGCYHNKTRLTAATLLCPETFVRMAVPLDRLRPVLNRISDCIPDRQRVQVLRHFSTASMNKLSTSYRAVTTAMLRRCLCQRSARLDGIKAHHDMPPNRPLAGREHIYSFARKACSAKGGTIARKAAFRRKRRKSFHPTPDALIATTRVQTRREAVVDSSPRIINRRL